MRLEHKTSRPDLPLSKKVPRLSSANLKSVIQKFASSYEAGGLSSDEITQLLEQLIDFGNAHPVKSDLSVSRLYEYDALLLDALGENERAFASIRSSAASLPSHRGFLTEWGEALYDQQQGVEPLSRLTFARSATQKHSYKTVLNRKLVYVISGVTLLIIVVIWQPIADWRTLKNANPQMIKLAQDAGMSKKGELVFLRTNPELVNDSQMESVCPASVSNSNGFIEQGCYLPSSNKIYIRQVPSDLYDLEVATAAYEMLHPVYNQLVNSGNGPSLNQAIEDNYSSINDSNLNSQVANFQQAEPGEKDLELFSLLGTKYSTISSDLLNYYVPYFDDITSTIDANNSVTQLFQNDQNQLAQLKSTISKDDSLANTAYYDSVSWANVGNQYEDDYNYNIYLQDLNAENSAIDQYNKILDDYNNLVTEFDGTQPINQLQVVQSQGQ